MAGLEMVSICTDEELHQAQANQQSSHLNCADDSYESLRTPNRTSPRSVGFVTSVNNPASSSGRRYSVGDPVSFTLERHELSHVATVAYPERFFGRVLSSSKDGSCVVEQAGGVRRNARQLLPATEHDLQVAASSKKGFVTRKGDFVDSTTPNAPAWGGGCGYSSGYRETSPHRSSRTTISRPQGSVSTPVLSKPSSSTRRRGNRSLSPPPLGKNIIRMQPVEGSDWQILEQGSLGEGCPVCFWLEGYMEPLFGRIRAVEASGSFAVECVGGRRLTGMRNLVACSQIDVEKASRQKQPTLTSTKDAWSERLAPYRPASRSPSPIPCLRGIPINSPPCSATRMPAP